MDRTIGAKSNQPEQMIALALRKKVLATEFLEATRAAASLDIQGDDESAMKELVRLIGLRESRIGEIDDIDRELAGPESDQAALSPQQRQMLLDIIETTRTTISEAATISGDLETTLALVCQQLQKQGARGGSVKSSGSTYGGAEKKNASPRFLDRRL